MKAYERFLKYVSVWTTSDETSETVPSADRELVLAELLVEEMKELGIEDARVDEKGYVYGSVPATLGCEKAPALGLIAHMDTAPDASGRQYSSADHRELRWQRRSTWNKRKDDQSRRISISGRFKGTDIDHDRRNNTSWARMTKPELQKY